MSRQRDSQRLNLDNVAMYSDIYGLGITDADVNNLTRLKTVFASRDVKYIQCKFGKSYDLTFCPNFTYDQLLLQKHEDILDTIGYSLFCIAGYYFKYEPLPEDVPFYLFLGKLADSDDVRSFNSEADFKKHLIDKRLDQILAVLKTKQDANAIFWLFNKTTKYNPNVYEIDEVTKEEVPGYVHLILDVLQLDDDTRIAFFTQHRYSWYDDCDVSAYYLKPGHRAYNWTDKDRFFSNYSSVSEGGRVYFTDADPVIPKDHNTVDVLLRGKDFILLDNQTVDLAIRREMRLQQEQAQERQNAEILQTKLKARIDELANGKTFSFNDIEFRKDEVEYENQILKADAFDTTALLGASYGHYNENTLNFDRLFEAFRMLVDRNVQQSQVNMTIGKVKVTAEFIVRQSANGSRSRSLRVNGIRINAEEFRQVLERALCYNDVVDFNHFVTSVSKCSLRFHKFLASGLNLKVRDENLDENVSFKIPLLRLKNKNFIVINGKQYKVLDTNKLLALETAGYMSKVIDTLLDPKVVGLTGKEIRFVVEEGTKIYLEQISRDENLLRDTMAMFNVDYVSDIQLTNGRHVSGYVVKGKLRDYIIEKEKLLVFEYPSGKYLCMVDKGQNEHTNVSRLVSRFYALSNDSKLASQIATIAK